MLKNYLEDIVQFEKWNTYINRIPLLSIGVEILKILEQYRDAYIVGGAVRDIITGEKEPDDIDIAINVPMDKIVNKIEEITKIYADKDFQSSLRKIVNGELIMRLKNLKPGPNVGKIINQTVE